MTEDSYDVAILGAGPTGLTLANILGQAGCRVALIERNPATVEEPRAVSIDDESLRTMQAIGLADSVIRDVALDYGSHYFTRRGTRFLAVEPSTREFGFPRRNAFTQPKLEAALRDGLRRYQNVSVLFERECRHVERVENGVSLLLHDRIGHESWVQADYLVGCDGAHSSVRQTVGATLSGSTYRQRWLIVDLAATRERLRQTRVVCNPARPLITLPGPDGIRRYEFMLHENEDESVVESLDFVRSLLASHGPDADAEIVRRKVYTFHARIADRWQLDRIFLAGDAAHLSPPFAGQGMNSGIRDAHNLGWKLAAVVTGRFGTGLLGTYQIERAPHARSLVDLAVNMGRIMMPRTCLQAVLVQTVFRLTRVAPRIQGYFAEMKYKPKPYYREGFLVTARNEFSIVGRMLPQPSVERRNRSRILLDDVIGTGFALIAYGPEAQRAIADANAFDFGKPMSVAILPQTVNPDPDAPHDIETVRDFSDALKALVPPDETIVLWVRPDRYVGAVARGDVASLAELSGLVRALGARTWPTGDNANTGRQRCRATVTSNGDEQPTASGRRRQDIDSICHAKLKI